MNKLIFAIALGAAIASTTSGAQAQNAPPPGSPAPAYGGGGWRQDMTRSQAQQRADAMFQRLDANHDGVLTRQEADQAAAQMGGGGGGGGRGARMIGRMFGDAQSMTQAQFEAASLARFDQQDLNHDGTVTAAERQQARGDHGGHGHGERG